MAEQALLRRRQPARRAEAGPGPGLRRHEAMETRPQTRTIGAYADMLGRRANAVVQRMPVIQLSAKVATMPGAMAAGGGKKGGGDGGGRKRPRGEPDFGDATLPDDKVFLLGGKWYARYWDGSAEKYLGPFASEAKADAARKGMLMQRLGRAKERARTRAERGDARSRAEQYSTVSMAGRTNKAKNKEDQPLPIPNPFGTVYMGKGPFTPQPFVRLAPPPSRSDEAKHKDVGKMSSAYTPLSATIEKSGKSKQIAGEMLSFQSSTSAPKPSKLKLTPKEQASASLLSGIQVVESHETRVEDGGKLMRGGLRTVQSGEASFSEVYNSKDAGYVSAKKGGQKAMREAAEDPSLLTDLQADVLDNMSASSDEEEDARDDARETEKTGESKKKKSKKK